MSNKQGVVEMDLVSIIVPVYNVEKYLQENISSLLKQTYKEIEIILVDDGSKDNSGYLCDQAAKKDSRIKVIHKENAGLGYARNSGLKVAQGKYVTFIDSDDVADIDLIQRMVDGINESGADTCIGGFKRIDKFGSILYKERYKSEVYSDNDVSRKLLIRMLGSAPNKHDAIKMSVWNVLYSMEIIKENNLLFKSEREFISEDIIWNLDYYKYSKKIIVIDSIAYGYRITPGSLTQTYKENKFGMICKLYKELKNRIDDVFIDDEAITRLQRQFFVNFRSCLKQEIYSSKSYFDIYKSIKEMCASEIVYEILEEYPVSKINLKAKFFLILIKRRMYIMITAFTIIGII